MSRRSWPRSSGDIWRCFCGGRVLTLLPVGVPHVVAHALPVLLAHLLLPAALAPPSRPRPRSAEASMAAVTMSRANSNREANRNRIMMDEMLRGLPCGRLAFCNNVLPCHDL